MGHRLTIRRNDQEITIVALLFPHLHDFGYDIDNYVLVRIPGSRDQDILRGPAMFSKVRPAEILRCNIGLATAAGVSSA
jgi:hypothetical protein